VTVRCPACSAVFKAWHRASINLSLGEQWTDEEIEEATSAGCPTCGTRFAIGGLIVAWD
jgi:DNA-directed RNA polymerase subunit RPC12/RpoP